MIRGLPASPPRAGTGRWRRVGLATITLCSGLSGIAGIGAIAPAGVIADTSSARVARTAIGVTGTGTTSRDDPRAMRALRRGASAERELGYRGTQFISTETRGDIRTELTDVVNIPGQGTVVRPSNVDAGDAFVPRRELTDRSLDSLQRFYTLRTAGTARSVGRPADVVEAVRSDGTLAGRFLLDRESGLLLRREAYDSKGRKVRTSGFVDFRLDPDAFVHHLPPVLGDSGRVTHDTAKLARSGWDCCKRTLAGAYALQEVREHGDSIHLTYTDGMANASIFQQHGRLAADALQGFEERDRAFVRYGSMSYAIWAHDGIVYTAICDLRECVDRIAAAFPHDAVEPGGPAPAGNGVPQRIGRGMGLLGSWLNPFD